MRKRSAWVATTLLLAGCSASAAAPLPFFQDVSAAPAVIQNAARAVVLVTIPDGTATGSFISPTGLLLTNNHVLGVGVCPVEGCFAQLSFSYQRGDAVEPPKKVFVVPMAVDVGLDVAVLQTYLAPGGPVLSTPDYLTIDARTPAALQGTHVNIVGHPSGSVKKWTAGEAVWSDGDWVWTTAFILPGSSGSPLLDDHGHLVGILHRSSTGLDLVTQNGVNQSSVGTASSYVVAALSEPLPPSTWSVFAPTTQADVVANQLVYLAAQTPTARVGSTSVQVLDALGAACDAALAVKDYASPSDASNALAPCLEAEGWIECRQDAMPFYGVCPADRTAWQGRFQAYFEFWRAFNGALELDEMSFAPAALADTMAGGQTSGAQQLQQALAEAQPALDFHVALHLAAFQIGTYQGTSVADFVRGYSSVPDYPLNGGDLVIAILWLANWNSISHSDAKSLLDQVHGDPNIDLGTKLFVEQAEYDRGILP
jgi:hypothetical protein